MGAHFISQVATSVSTVALNVCCSAALLGNKDKSNDKDSARVRTVELHNCICRWLVKVQPYVGISKTVTFVRNHTAVQNAGTYS